MASETDPAAALRAALECCALVDRSELSRLIGERIVNLERLFIAREGITRQDDVLPGRFIGEPMPEGSGPSTGAVLELEHHGLVEKK